MITKDEALAAYAALVQLRREQPIEKSKEHLGQVETHHILPVSCGGKDVPENKVELYAKEHFMAHVYLWAIHHDDEFHYQTVCALNAMVKGTLTGLRQELRDFILASEEYQKAREEHALFTSQTIAEKISGEKNGSFGKHWYYDPVTLSCSMLLEEDCPEGWINGRIYSSYDGFKLGNQKSAANRKNKILVYNPSINKIKYIDPGEKIPDGFIKGGRPVPKDERLRISNTLRTKSPKGTQNPKHVQEQIEFFRPRYKYFLKFGFKAMVKNFNYPYTYENFIQQCQVYLPEYSKN